MPNRIEFIGKMWPKLETSIRMGFQDQVTNHGTAPLLFPHIINLFKQ